MALEILGFNDDAPRTRIEDGDDYTKWRDLDSTLRRLGSRATAGNKAALAELVEAGPAMRAEMDRLATRRQQKIEQTVPPFDDVHSSTD